MKNLIIEKTNFYLIALLPIFILVGSLVLNLSIILVGILFLLDIFFKDKFKLLKEKNFIFLIIFYLYIILNSLITSNDDTNFYKAIAYIRFILLAYALNYYFETYKNKIIKSWTLIFLIVSCDILIEFIFGRNILGFSSNYPARIASFTGDELIIGSFYFCFICFALSFIKSYNNSIFYICFVLFLIISLIIGERSNFLKILIIYFFIFVSLDKISSLKKIFTLFVLLFVCALVIQNIDGLRTKYTKHIFDIKNNNFYSDATNKFEKFISSNRHLGHYYVAHKIFKDNKLFGSGFRTYRIESYKEKYIFNNILAGSTHPHQIHFEILSDLGLIGYFLIIFNIVKLMFNQRDFKLENIKFCSFLFMIAFLFPLIPSGSFFTTNYAIIFWINYSFLIQKGKKI